MLASTSTSSRMASGRTSSVFGAGRVALSPVQRRTSRAPASALAPRAYVRQYPNPEFIAEVKKAFPEKGIASPDEARVLFAEGYTWLDVRPTLEYEDAGKVRGSVNIPIMNMTKKFVGEGVDKKKVFEKSPNPDFIKMVQRKFPKKSHPLLVGCSDGKTYSIDALMALDEAGYTNLVGVLGGYYGWFRVFDNKLVRRNLGEYQEKYDGEGSDSCGIHASGAGFDRADKIEAWVPPKY